MTDPTKLREIILNAKQPLVLRNFSHKWSCFKSDDLNKWCKELDTATKEPTNFERISKFDCKSPQWERKRQSVNLYTQDFLEEHAEEREYWSGMNYKRKQDLPKQCTEGIDFACFGFPHATDDCTFWLSSQGANTPCHYDSYGCNIVVQVYGSKSWLLFPPGTKLNTTRIPYEESSVYCRENFYAPDLVTQYNIFENLKDKAYHVILQANDVLIVPRHWWHYVEAMEISLSVNAWIPLKCDLDMRIEELIVKYLIENFVGNLTKDVKAFVLNPNQISQISSEEDLFAILEHLLKQKEILDESEIKKSCAIYDYNYLSDENVKRLVRDNDTFQYVPALSANRCWEILQRNSLRCKSSGSVKPNPLNHYHEILINSICNPNTVHIIKEDFFERLKIQTRHEELSQKEK